MLEELRKGLQHFQNNTYNELKDTYSDLSNTQNPHTLFITCSDSRISPEKLMDLKPGDAFIVRNISNTVPEKDYATSDLTTISAIEFAVEVLGVKQIIVCGHSNCGGCKAVMTADKDNLDSSYVTQYIEPLFKVRDIVEEMDVEDKMEAMERMNAVVQANHLSGYDFIKEKVDQGDLNIEAWHYNIGEGKVHVYDEQKEVFVDHFDS